MNYGTVASIYLAPSAGAPMRHTVEAEAIADQGLRGDRYCDGLGSYNKGAVGSRQVTLINTRFLRLEQPFRGGQTRRNIVTSGVELMWLIGRTFQIGGAEMLGIKYCDPCKRPSKLAGLPDFDKIFEDGGGLVAAVTKSGLIRVGDKIIPPPKGY